MKHEAEARRIWQEHVPKSGQSMTVEGELLRAVEKLRDGAVRNGNLTWDRGFAILLEYRGDHLQDPAVFSYEAAGRTSAILRRLRDHGDPLLDDGAYDWLADQVVDYLRHHGSRPRELNPELRR